MKTEIQRAKNPTLTYATDAIIAAVRGKRSNSYTSSSIDPNYNHFRGFNDAFKKIKTALESLGFSQTFVESHTRDNLNGEKVTSSVKHRYVLDGKTVEVTGYYACGANIYVKCAL